MTPLRHIGTAGIKPTQAPPALRLVPTGPIQRWFAMRDRITAQLDAAMADNTRPWNVENARQIAAKVERYDANVMAAHVVTAETCASSALGKFGPNGYGPLIDMLERQSREPFVAPEIRVVRSTREVAGRVGE